MRLIEFLTAKATSGKSYKLASWKSSKDSLGLINIKKDSRNKYVVIKFNG